MATHTGNMAPWPSNLTVSSVISTNITNMPVNIYGQRAVVKTATGSGSLTSNQPITISSRSHTGILAPSFFDMWYNRIHVYPNNFALGNILTNSTEYFYVWNAYLTSSQTCNSIDEVNPTEAPITGASAPFTLDPLEESDYTIQISVEGSANFTTTYTFNFTALGKSFIVTITGDRLVSFLFAPQSPIKESCEFKTNLMISHNGTEQRERLRAKCVQSFNYLYKVSEQDEKIYLKNIIMGWMSRIYGFPIWTEMSKPSITINIGDSSITTDTTNGFYTNNALFWKDWDNFEIVGIENVTDTGFDVPNTFQQQWVPPYTMAPLRTGNILNEVNSNIYYGDNLADFSLNCVLTDKVGFDTYTPTDTYDSIAVLQETLKVDIKMPKKHFANSQYSLSPGGVVSFLQTWTIPKITKTIIFNSQTRTEINNYKALFNYLYGQQKTIWIPLYENDLILTRTVGISDTNVFISNFGYTKYSNNNTRNHLVLFNNGTWLYREITGFSEVSDTEEVFTINSAFGVEIVPGEKTLYFIVKHRLASDKIDIDWKGSNGEAEVKLSFVEVE